MNSNEEKVKASIVLEVLGRPPEHITTTLKGLIEQVGKEDGVKVLNSDLKAPILMKNQKDFYTTFAEVGIETSDMMKLVLIMFKYMPAHVEVIEPQSFSLTNSDFDEVLNELTRRLHGYEELARVLQMEKKILESKLRDILAKKEENKPEEEKKSKKSKSKKDE